MIQMTGAEFAEVRSGLGLTQGALAPRLGVTRVTVARWEALDEVPEAAGEGILALGPENADPPAAGDVAPVPADWRELTDEERWALPPGSPGWKYRPGTPLARGQWVEVLDKPMQFPNGAICTKIRWGSNGVGAPTMNLIGSTEHSVGTDLPEFRSLPPGYRAMAPNKGNPEFAKAADAKGRKR